jgi:predicted metal-dependent HD superfamily phosphohydrolase
LDNAALVHRAWREAMDAIAAPPDLSAAAFARLTAAYASSERHYHGLSHLTALLTLARKHAALVRDRLAVDLAILFHDVVYDPRRADNEEMSARYAECCLHALAAPSALVEKVTAWIRVTAHGTMSCAVPDADLAFLLDIDLSILASPPDAYREYAAAVRREYGHVPDSQFRAGRARVLRHFLDRPAIYITPPLHAVWENAARSNLAAELAVLDNDEGSRRPG